MDAPHVYVCAWALGCFYSHTSTQIQALVYDILPSTAAVFSYIIGSRKLSANEEFYVGAQTVVCLLQTIQIIPDVCFILPCCLSQLKYNQNRLNQ